MDRIALITGASEGIGLELARIHAAKGDDLILVARTGSRLDVLKTDLEQKFNIKVHNIIKDLTLVNACSEIYDEVRRKGMSITYLINNAGIGDFGYFAESDWEKQERMIDLNITALAHLTRLFLPDMITMGGGKILNVASMAAFQPGPSMSVYFATKAFVLSFSQALNNELSGIGVTVTALCPGPVETNFHAVVMDDPGLVSNREMATAKEVAEYGYRAMMKGKTVAIPGFKNSLMAFAVRFLPREFIVKMARKIQEKKHLI